jgi:hypothetical protein
MGAERPSIEALKQAIDYDPETGNFTWKERSAADFKDLILTAERQAQSWNERNVGKPALTAGKATYAQGKILGYKELAHRLAFALHFGRWPIGEIDHINGDPRDNRIENLRDVPPLINKRNKKLNSRNRSGTQGVIWDAKAGSWIVTIGARDKRRYLGSFKSLDEAVSARKKAEAELGYHANHGRTSL